MPRLGLTFQALTAKTLNSKVQAWKLSTKCEKKNQNISQGFRAKAGVCFEALRSETLNLEIQAWKLNTMCKKWNKKIKQVESFRVKAGA
jgi:phage-related protein